MINGSWTDALTASVSVSIVLCTNMSPEVNTVRSKFMAPRFTIYRAICERLETIDHILDASRCFRQMVGEFTRETIPHREQAEWLEGGSGHVCRCKQYLMDLV